MLLLIELCQLQWQLQSEEDIVKIIRFAAQNKISITTIQNQGTPYRTNSWKRDNCRCSKHFTKIVATDKENCNGSSFQGNSR